MHKPVFLSVGGHTDTAFAKEVHRLLGDSLSYHYQVTGEEGIGFWSEIEGALQGTLLFVVFWSHDYLKSDATKRELAFFRKLAESGIGREMEVLIVPRGTDLPDFQSRWTNPITEVKDEFVLGDWRNVRSVDANSDEKRVANLIRRKLESKSVIQDVLIPRGWLVDQMTQAVRLPDYKMRELVFISGLEGNGRRTVIRQYMKQAAPTRVERLMPLDSVDGPLDLLIPLMDAASMPAALRHEVLIDIDKGTRTPIKEIRTILHQARDNKSYYVIAIERFIGADFATIPIWMSELLSVFKYGPSPLIFITTSGPVSDALLSHFPEAARIQVPGLEDEEMDELVHRLSMEDPSPQRWNNTQKASVARACGSSPSLCKSVMTTLSYESTLDFVQQIAKRAEENFGQALASLLAHWTKLYRNRHSDLMALRIIEKLGATSREALDEIITPVVEQYGPHDLYGLRNQGLVEQLADGLYRIPRLIQRRLGTALWQEADTQEIDELFRKFSQRVLVAKTEYGAMYAKNAITASLRVGQQIAPEYEAYLTVAMLFKSGMERYSNREYKVAYSIFKRAMKRITANNQYLDVATKIEIARFYGLSAVRTKDGDALHEACQYLEDSFKQGKRQSSALAMSFFLQGFQARNNSRRFDDAVRFYEKALQYLEKEHFAERQRGAIYTELSATYMRTLPPDFRRSLDYAKLAFEQNDVTHTLNAYIHALNAYTFELRRHTTVKLIQPYLDDISLLLTKLKARCEELRLDFYTVRKKEFDDGLARWTSQHAPMSQSYSPQRIALPFNNEFSPDELSFE